MAPFPRGTLLALGEGVDAETDPMDWIADWKTYGEGYLPASLPYKHWNIGHDATSPENAIRGVTPEESRQAKARGIRTIRVVGLRPDRSASAILYGSDDGVRWTPLRRFDPRVKALVLTPPRLFWRLLLCVGDESGAEAVFLE